MARLQCRSCGFDKETEWDGRLVCPSCGSTNARVAAPTAEMPDEFFEAVIKSLSDAAEKPPAMILRCHACSYEFRVAEEIAAWPTSCPKCGHRRVGLADCVQDVAIDLKVRTMRALPEIEFSDSASADPYESLKKALGREPTARDIEVYVATRRAARRDDA